MCDDDDVSRLILNQTVQSFDEDEKFLKKMTFENIVKKGENAGNQHFLLFPQCFLFFQKIIFFFESHLICRLLMLSIFRKARIL